MCYKKCRQINLPNSILYVLSFPWMTSQQNVLISDINFNFLVVLRRTIYHKIRLMYILLFTISLLDEKNTEYTFRKWIMFVGNDRFFTVHTSFTFFLRAGVHKVKKKKSKITSIFLKSRIFSHSPSCWSYLVICVMILWLTQRLRISIALLGLKESKF